MITKDKIISALKKECQHYNSDGMLEYAEKIKENFGLILLLYILISATTLIDYIRGDEPVYFIVFAVTFFYIAQILARILTRLFKVHIFLRYFIVFILSLPAILEAFLYYKYSIFIKTGNIAALLETTPNEAREFLISHVDFYVIFFLIMFIAIIFLMKKYQPWQYIHLGRNVKVYSMAVYLCSFLICVVYLGAYGWEEFTTVKKVCPQVRFMVYTREHFINLAVYEELAKKINTDVKLTKNKSEIKNIVFILGESTNRNHMNLYGYYVNNTPNLKNMENNGELIKFNDCISPYAATTLVVKELFTFHNAESEEVWYKYNNIVDIMKAAGYKTFWLSNQESSGVWGNFARSLAERSDKYQFVEKRDSRDNGGVDGKLLPIISETIANEQADKNFYIIHLLGCHQKYSWRYPEEFDKFSADDIEKDISEEKKKEIAEYENAVLYNDYIVNDIIEQFRNLKEDTLIIYLSDHGEEVYDLLDMASHSGDVESSSMYEIPVMIWGSDKFKKNHADKWENIKNSVDRPYMTDDMIHTVLDIAEIETADYDETRSLTNPRFDTSRKRIINASDDKNRNEYYHGMK